MQGYDIDGIGPGGDGSGGIPPGGATTPAVDNTIYPGDRLFGWSLQNTAAGLSTVYLRFGSEATSTPYIAVNLAENETVTQIFEGGLPTPDGVFLTVEAGTIDGLLYTS